MVTQCLSLRTKSRLVRATPLRYMGTHMRISRKICLEYQKDRDRYMALPPEEEMALDDWEFTRLPTRIFLERPEDFLALCMGFYHRLGGGTYLRMLPSAG